MRRHRRGYGGAPRDSSEIDRRCPKKQRSNLLCLDLNLNLPAPEDDTREKSGCCCNGRHEFGGLPLLITLSIFADGILWFQNEKPPIFVHFFSNIQLLLFIHIFFKNIYYIISIHYL